MNLPARPTRPAWLRVLPWLTALSLSACIVVPQTQTVYDHDCQTQTRQVTLEAAYISGFAHCAGDGCVAMLATAGFVTAASVVVSGSIAIVGNVVYWLERQGRCQRAAPAGAAPAPAGATRPTAASSAPQ